MNWNRALIGIAAGVVLGLIAGTFVYTEFKKALAVKPVVASYLVVAATPLPLGTRLQPQHLRLIPWPAGEPLRDGFTRIEDCVDRALVAAAVENEPILESRLAPKEAGAGLPAIIPEGMRALSVAVNDVVAVAGFVVPGTTVDVLVTGSVAGGNSSITRTILENVRVLAAGQKIEQDKDGKPQTVPVITLLVTPEEANKLAMASTQGKIQLSLRNTMDTKRADPPPVLQVNLFGGAPPAPRSTHARTQPGTAPPPSTFAVEVIRGAKREVDNFPNP
jgi:pilus assembly protein CpaB